MLLILFTFWRVSKVAKVTLHFLEFCSNIFIKAEPRMSNLPQECFNECLLNCLYFGVFLYRYMQLQNYDLLLSKFKSMRNCLVTRVYISFYSFFFQKLHVYKT